MQYVDCTMSSDRFTKCINVKWLITRRDNSSVSYDRPHVENKQPNSWDKMFYVFVWGVFVFFGSEKDRVFFHFLEKLGFRLKYVNLEEEWEK